MIFTYDTHAHLDQVENLDEAMINAEKAGVKGVVCVSMDAFSCQKNLEIKRRLNHPPIFLAMGMHPSEADLHELTQCQQLIKAHHHELHAIGEIGLDFWYKWVKKDELKRNEQRQVFRALLGCAKEYNLPAIIHARGTWQECLDIAKEIGIKKAVFHWYSGPIDVLQKILAEGYYVSTSPSVAYSSQSREAMSFAPIEQTLIETDSPVFYRLNNDVESAEGFKSEPKDVFRTLEAYCLLKNIDQYKASEVLNKNTQTLFGLN